MVLDIKMCKIFKLKLQKYVFDTRKKNLYLLKYYFFLEQNRIYNLDIIFIKVYFYVKRIIYLHLYKNGF